jgi:1-acyl-sn-glycerol-3-phosphate acyltransferase
MNKSETVKAFWQALARDGAYETPEDLRRSVPDRLLGRFDAWYYLLALNIVVSANLLSRRGRFDRLAWGQHGYRTLRAAERCGGKVRITGVEHLATLDGGVVFVANHMSMFETFVLPAILLGFKHVHTVVKQSLCTYPLFGVTMRATDPIAVGRTNPREDLKAVLSEGREILDRGESVVVFPQATRMREFDPSKFNSIGTKLAGRAGVPVVPVALKTDFQGVGRLLRDVGPLDRSQVIHFSISAPLVSTLSTRTVQDEAVRFISEHLRQWGATVKGA